MHGLGNDYVCVDLSTETVQNPSSLARVVANRHRGVGCDGLLLIDRSDRAEIRMAIYNADGSRAEMCGNGIRCVAKYAVEHGLAPGPELRIETDAGVKTAECRCINGRVRDVRIDMGVPSLAAENLPSDLGVDRLVEHPLVIAGTHYNVTAVSMGNPHLVVFLDDLKAVDLALVGPHFENAPDFPKRINTHFARVKSPARVTIKTWERGSGATDACGTGACAVCVAGVITGRTERAITASLPGGDLKIEWGSDDHVYMTGPAVEVFTGTCNPS
jgi:diaminopimelate epimerase